MGHCVSSPTYPIATYSKTIYENQIDEIRRLRRTHLIIVHPNGESVECSLSNDGRHIMVIYNEKRQGWFVLPYKPGIYLLGYQHFEKL